MASYLTLSEDRARLLGEWLRKCDNLHGSKCHVLTPIAERSPQHVPDWVIDTEKECIVPGKSVDRYAALSYVWSASAHSSDKTAPERLLLQQENLLDLQTPGYLSADFVTSNLPMIIRDSIRLTSQSGTRYLWVDCLCVVQRDRTTDAKMEFLPEIYSGAFFTIIAAAKANGLHGSMTETRNLTEKMSVHSLHGALLASHWATRGWTFQEHVLSKRSIIFLDGAMFWDCQCSVWWAGDQTEREQDSFLKYEANDQPSIQSGELKEEKIIDKDHTTDKELYQQLGSLSTPDFSLYRELVCRYNHRDLTYDQDVLRAFSGVLNELSRGFYGGFASGLPILFLDSVLLWQPLRKAKRRIADPDVQHVAPKSPLPTWSWAGWQCLIDPGSLESCLDYQVELSSDDGTSRSPGTWTTSNLVQWQVLHTKDDTSLMAMDGPALLEHYKTFKGKTNAKNLPNGWSSTVGLEKYPVYKYELNSEDSDHSARASARRRWSRQQRGLIRSLFQRLKVHKYEPETYRNNSALRSRSTSWEKKQVTWFYHGSRDRPLYRYPLPMPIESYPNPGPGNVSFLSCVTTTAEFRIRRVLYPCPVPQGDQPCSALSVSVLDTDVYNKVPNVDACCPVITLEDHNGKWAGLMRAMDDIPTICATDIVKVVAVSRGSCSNLDAALTYEAAADRGGIGICGASNRSMYLGSSDLLESLPGGRDLNLLSVCFTPASDRSRRSGVDKGPIYPPSGCCVESQFGYDTSIQSVPEGWREQIYEFYNVLWVEQRDGIMYRKAAGRISRDIWDDNCGKEQRIVLG